jgi:hypothetical protein
MKTLKFSMKSHAVMLVALQTEIQEPSPMNPRIFLERHGHQELVLITSEFISKL